MQSVYGTLQSRLKVNANQIAKESFNVQLFSETIIITPGRKGVGCVSQQPATSTPQGACITVISFPAMSVDSNTPFQADRIGYDVAMEWVANAPAPVHSEAAGPTVSAPSVPDAADNARHDDTATFEQTGDPLLLIGRDSGRQSQGDPAESLDLRSFQ